MLRYTSPVTQKRRNAGLGTYPAVSIAQAAKLALEMQEQIQQGLDPLEEKKKIQEIQQTPTFESAAYTVHKEQSPAWKHSKHINQWINTLKDYAFPTLGNLKLDAIEPRHIATALRPIWLDKPETARRVKQRIHAVLKWGWAHGFCISNPADVVDSLLPPQPSKSTSTEHHLAMDWREIPKFVQIHVTIKDKSNVTRSLLEFVILTACRSGEARGARWTEIDWENQVWEIPAERMKMKTPHRVPLNSRAVEILHNQRGLHPELIFPSPRAGKELSDMALTKYLRDVDAPSTTKDRPATAHGFRSSFRDWCSEHGYARDLAERALAHTVQNKVEAAYHRTDLLEQRRPMMQDWCDFVCSVSKADKNTDLDLKRSFLASLGR
ncbi:integrase [Paenalcaligenes hominis]|nr:integrase [Paenalcaligenes hominis]